ncbi:MAG: enoyl-CoA hydratase-related protein, partial [Desulfobacterales bacterium]|nr:enoyl-CoA hydratase-related protein [Desulfobacterales bacterium]
MSEEFTTIHYEIAAPGVARVEMDRYPVRNAQNVLMSCELDAAFDQAIRDDSVKVIILAAADPHFSAGHDLSGYDGTGLG